MTGGWKRRALAMIAVVDFLVALSLVQQAEIARMRVITERPSAPTYGQYAVVVRWPGQSRDDVDLYVRDPQRNVCFFLSPQIGQMQLEHDDRGVDGTSYFVNGVRTNYERIIIRGLDAGEFVVDVQMFKKRAPGPTPVEVQLWTLRGNDRVIKTVRFVLAKNGDWRTAFRFTLGRTGSEIGFSSLPVNIVNPNNPYAANYQGGA